MTMKALLAAGLLGAAALPAQAQSPYQAPRTTFGAPDLEGTWTNVTLTRLERAPEYGERQALTPQEVARLEGAATANVEYENQPTDPSLGAEDHTKKNCDGAAGLNCGYNVGWKDPAVRVMRVGGEPRTSIITSPANGRIAYKQPRSRGPAEPSDNPEDRSLPERCLVSQNIRNGALMTSTLYNNNYQIVQSPGAVAIIVEMSHDARLVRLDAKHRNDGVRPWFGDSIGRYEGDTLVVETINFHPLQLSGMSEKLKLTERFTRVGKDAILYAFTVEDPDTYARPWSGEYEFTPSSGPIYEYACHEGNRGLENILAGARFEERQAQAPKPVQVSDR